MGVTEVNTVCQGCEMETVLLIRNKLPQRILVKDKGICPLIVRSFGGAG